jgi:hypothetical protein
MHVIHEWFWYRRRSRWGWRVRARFRRLCRFVIRRQRRRWRGDIGQRRRF